MFIDIISAEEADKLIEICDQRNGWVASPQKDSHAHEVTPNGEGIDQNAFTVDGRRTSDSCPLIWPLLYLASLDKVKASGKYTIGDKH